MAWSGGGSKVEQDFDLFYNLPLKTLMVMIKRSAVKQILMAVKLYTVIYSFYGNIRRCCFYFM